MSRREGTFRVTCTASGGTLSTSSLTGPGLGGGGLQLQAEGSIGRTGKNTYSVTSGILSGQSNGDMYSCTAINSVSSLEISIVLAGTCIHTCIIISNSIIILYVYIYLLCYIYNSMLIFSMLWQVILLLLYHCKKCRVVLTLPSLSQFQ